MCVSLCVCMCMHIYIVYSRRVEVKGRGNHLIKGVGGARGGALVILLVVVVAA